MTREIVRYKFPDVPNCWSLAETILEQAGGFELYGAANLIGCPKVCFFPDEPPKKLLFPRHISFNTNTAARHVLVHVCYKPGPDLYRVFLTKETKTLDELDDVYCDMLIDVIDGLYTKYINKYEGGAIPI